jgi:pimeloyl-ACP methyl ester carboxylesterase
MPIRRVNGAELHVEESGAGAETIVFAHGLLFSTRQYDAQVAHLRERYRCVAYDHRGQGLSPPSPGPYDMDTLADDAAALVRELGAPVHFVGLSMGGFVGLRLAARRPQLLRSLVLIDSAADREPRPNVPRYRAMALMARAFGYRPLIRPVMRILFGRAFRADPARAELRRAQELHLLGLREPATRAALEAVITRKAVEDELAAIRTPTLILHGEADAAIPLKRARRMASAIPGARYLPVARAGHMASIEEPEAVTREIEAFLAAVGGQA